jgi:hypothetical protein
MRPRELGSWGLSFGTYAYSINNADLIAATKIFYMQVRLTLNSSREYLSQLMNEEWFNRNESYPIRSSTSTLTVTGKQSGAKIVLHRPTAGAHYAHQTLDEESNAWRFVRLWWRIQTEKRQNTGLWRIYIVNNAKQTPDVPWYGDVHMGL